MHILFLTPQLPYPPRQGTSIRNYHLIAHLAQRHTLDLLTFLAPGDDLNSDNPLYKLCRRIKALPQPTRSLIARAQSTFFSRLPDMALRLEATAMHNLVRAWLAENEVDIVQVEGIELAQYSRHIADSWHADQRRTNHKRIQVVFDDHNCEYLLQQRSALTDLAHPQRWHAAAYSLVQWAKLRHYEAQVCRAADGVVAVSGPDQDALQAIAPSANIIVAPNGIDLDDYANPSAALPPSLQSDPSQSDSGRFTLLFSGKMDYRPNIDAALWFGQKVLPIITSINPHVCWQIVGMNPHPRLNALRRNPAIEIIGGVPDMRPYLYGADVHIIPMRVGGGTRFKALEAMACAKPIVSTTLGIEGLGITAGNQMLLADTPAGFAAHILELAQDKNTGSQLAQQLGRAAYAHVASHYTWEKIIPAFERLYTTLQAETGPIQPHPRTQGVLL